MPPLPSVTLIVNFDPGDTDLVVRQFLPPGSRISATKPSAVASGSTVIVLDSLSPGPTAIWSDPKRSLASGEPATRCRAK